MKQGFFSGYIGSKPRYTEGKKGRSGVCFFNFCAAGFKNNDYDNDIWVDVACYGATADFVDQYAKVGSFVVVEGRITEIKKYKGDSGTRLSLGLRASSVELGKSGGKKGRHDDDDDEDDRGSSRRRRDRDDEDEEPRGKRRRDDDEEEKPSRRKDRDEEEKPSRRRERGDDEGRGDNSKGPGNDKDDSEEDDL